MRRQVPFVGEGQIARASDQEQGKRAAARVIDEMVSTSSGESSWDDLVPSNWPSQGPEHNHPSASVSLGGNASDMKQTSSSGRSKGPGGKSLHAGMVPARPHGHASHNPVSHNPARTTTIVYSDKPSLDWVLINNGRGLRINVSGNIDHDMRLEWRRMLEETESTAAGEFEFNLSHTPALSLTGLGMLLLFKERKGSLREAIKLCNCNKDVAQLLRWTGMEKYFVIQSSVPLDS